MRDLLLIAALGAMFLFGYHLMGGLDHFLQHNHRALAQQASAQQACIRIGLSAPLTADSVALPLERFSAIYPDTKLRFFGGNSDMLTQALSDGRLDFVLLAEQCPGRENAHWRSVQLFLRSLPVLTEYSALPVEPLTDCSTPQTLLWRKTSETQPLRDFVRCLQAAGNLQ